MITIAICDDEAEQRALTEGLVRDYLQERPATAARIFVCASGAELLNLVDERGAFDIYILDVIMPELSGIQTGLALRERCGDGAIIYLTASTDYAMDSYLARAFYYLLKPVEKTRFFAILDEAAERAAKREADCIAVSCREETRRVPLDDILYVELVGRSARYYLKHGGNLESTALRTPFRKAMEPLLRDGRFALCGVSFAVNLHHITAVEKTELHFTNGARVPLPRSEQVTLKRAWMNYWLEGGRGNGC